MSPVGGGVLNVAPALPLREKAVRCPRAPKLIKLHLWPFSLILEICRCLLHDVVSLTVVVLCVYQLVIFPIIIVPVCRIVCSVGYAELYPLILLHKTRKVDGKRESVDVFTTINVIHVSARNVSVTSPRVECYSHMNDFLKAHIGNFHRAGERSLLNDTVFQTYQVLL